MPESGRGGDYGSVRNLRRDRRLCNAYDQMTGPGRREENL